MLTSALKSSPASSAISGGARSRATPEPAPHVLGAVDRDLVVVDGGHDRGGAVELGWPRGRRRSGLDVGDELVGLVGAAQRLADDPGLVVPRHPVVDDVLGLGDGGGDLAELVVLGLGQARVDREDQVGPQRGDLLESTDAVAP